MTSRTEPKDLVNRLGFTHEALAAHPSVLRMFQTSDAWRQQHQDAASLPSNVGDQLAYEQLVPLIRTRLVPAVNGSTTSNEFSVVLLGAPTISVRSRGGMPWMLPWTVTAGSESWEVADPAISLAMLELADPSGPSARLLDGRAYSRDELWQDALKWASQPGPGADTK